MFYPNQTKECAKWRIPPSMIEGTTYYANELGHIETAAGYELADKIGPSHLLNKGGSKYIHTTVAGKEREIHRLICAARWGKPRKGQECHHLNGNKFDNRPDNLIWLAKPRHRIYDARLRDLKALLGNQGILIFSRQDFIRFACMSDKNFTPMLSKFHREDPSARMEYELTHHMEE